METSARKVGIPAAIVSVLCALVLALGFAWADDSVTELTSDSLAEDSTLEAGEYELAEDVTLSGSNITVTGDVTIDLAGHTLTGTGSGAVISGTDSSGSLTIKDSTESLVQITDASEIESFSAGVVRDTDSDGNATGTWTTYYTSVDEESLETTYWAYSSGAITGGSSSSEGGGVRMEDGSTFTMEGGTITGNTTTSYGGALFVESSATIKGGSLSGNSSTAGGAVFLRSTQGDATFSVEGGVISDNTDSGTAQAGGAIWLCNERTTSTLTFSMSGGTISGNAEATGDGGAVAMKYERDNSYLVFDMSGGVICDNSASSGDGGGVFLCCRHSTITSGSLSGSMTGGIIANNTAQNGGGVAVDNPSSSSNALVSLTMSGGAICGNTASSLGGGVYVSGASTNENCTLKLTGGTVSDNTAATGGGVAADDYGTLAAASGALANNTASTAGADLYVDENAIATSSSLSGMNSSVLYAGDGYELYVEGWYEDVSGSRYNSVENANITDEVTELSSGSAAYLIAAHGTSYPVNYSYTTAAGEDGSETDYITAKSYSSYSLLSLGEATGYTFSGWYTSEDMSGTPVTVLDGVSPSDEGSGDEGGWDLYGDYDAISYTIAFDANGGEGSMDSLFMTYDEAATLTANSFTRTGYTFSGWNTAADGSGTSYSDGESVENLSSTDGATVTLYAQWEVNTYTVTYDDGMTAFTLFTTYSVEVDYGDSVPAFKYDTPYFASTYSFMGWSVTVDGETLDGIYEDPTTITVTGDTTLTAVFGKKVSDFDDQSYTYDGQEHEFDLSSSSLSDFSVTYYEDEDCTTELEGYPTTVGTYYVKITREASDVDTASSRYAAFEQVATLTIEPATLTASYSLETITYGETPELAVTVTGFVNDETAETASGYVAPTITLSDDDLDVGTHTLTPSGGAADNYSFTYVSASLVVTPATIEFQIVDNYWDYDGTAHSSVVNVVASSIVNVTDTVTVSYSTTGEDGSYTTVSPSYTDAGSYKIYFTIESDNYYTVTGAYWLTISSVTPTLSMSGATVTYTGEPQTLTASLAGVSDSDTPSGTVSYSYVDSDGNAIDEAPTDVGTYTVTATYTPGEDDNYSETSTSAKLVIEPVTLTATYAGETITYGQTPELEVTVTGFVNDETAGTASGYTAPTLTTSETDAGSYTLTPSGGSADNYSFEYVSGTLLINKATPTVTASDVSATYDGESHLVSDCTVAGVDGEAIEGATVTISYTDENGEAATPVDAGTYTATVTYAGSDNYESASTTATVTIAKATLECSAEGYSGVYDGASHGITVTAPEGATITYATSEDGEYGTDAITYTDACEAQTVYYQVSMDNYETATGSATVTIAKATPTVAAEDVSATYDGSSHTVASYAVTGVDGELGSATCTVTYADEDGNAVEAPVNAGTYTATVTYAGSDNYESASTTATVTIAKATPTVSVTDVAVSYGEDYSVDAAVTGVGTELDEVEPSLSYYSDKACSQELAAAPTAVGTWYVKASYAGSDNYEPASATGVIVISESSFSFHVDGWEGIYDGESHAATVDAPEGAAVSIVYSYVDESGQTVTLDGAPSDAGEYTATFTISLEGYSDVTGTTAIIISKATPELSFASEGLSAHVSDETAETNALSGVQESANVSYESSDTTVATVASDGTVSIVGAGEATITATAAATDNYTSASASYTLTVSDHGYEGVVTQPTCTEDGYTTYTCTICNDSYKADETTAIGHDWDYDYISWTWTESEDGWTVTASVKCDNDPSHVLEASKVEVEGETIDATCNDDGAVVYTATASFGEGADAVTATDVLTVAESATGHDYDYADADFSWTEAEDGTVWCQATVTCAEGDDSILVDADVEVTATVDPSCEEEGSITYTATITDEDGNAYTDDYVVAVPANGHSLDYDNVTWTWSEGYDAASVEAPCSVCGHTVSADAELTYDVHDDKTCTITATAEIDGHVYTDTQDVSKFLFTDVEDPDTYYFEAVYALYYDGIVNGYSDTVYGVGDDMTRSQFALILWRMAGSPEATESADYPDVDSSKHYAEAIDWCTENGVFLGYGNGYFGPKDSITFEQMCVVIARYACGGEDNLSAAVSDEYAIEVLAGFDDVDEVSTWAENGMAWCVENGLVMGYEDGSLDPLSDVSRERAAVVIWRAVEDGIL